MAEILRFLKLFVFNSIGKEQNTATSGLLEIDRHLEQKSYWNWLISGGSRKISTAYFVVKHNRKNIVLPEENSPVPYFWQALFLKDTPKPTVLAASKNMYLITDEGETAAVKKVNRRGDNFNTYQWLDGENGQPMQKKEIHTMEESRSIRTIAGGSYLLIGTNVILNVQTLDLYHFDVSSPQSPHQLTGYQIFDSRAVGLSPGKSQILFTGYRRNTKTQASEYALIAIDFCENSAYTVPFDRKDTNFFSVWDATYKWVDTYFEWSRDTSGKEILILKNAIP
ncbi:hypothetical protein DYBT9275_05704 [Dyadobacter sp. CECT 9275]|uniref:Uncharacterized protein n=1 Tax=Dyadobacter helix TaxID=2822344 RepID=A0A916N8L7_9BACT|nr:hypothetical protein [Dyadobacter sp. CECT 9275]CAG5017117.1 hypothetical protein DYBT9275_05704 [Dyadobacter sp. CECT 9275]